jgi:hypothetical protein
LFIFICILLIDFGRVHKNDTFLIEPTTHQNMQTLTLGEYDYEHLKIPRKPTWTKEMTAEDIDIREKDAFLLWRREIAVGILVYSRSAAHDAPPLSEYGKY